MLVKIILKRSLAFTTLEVKAGMIMDWPVFKKLDFPLITISALPSMI